MNHDLKHLKDITLLIKAESIDSIVRRNGGVPIPEERTQYAAIIGELERRGHQKGIDYYKQRLHTTYQPTRAYEAWTEEKER